MRKKVASVDFWWHSIDLGQGVVTPGFKRPEVLEDELAKLQLPVLNGKTVLDIGAWDGFFSFEAERRGAQRVVALDHYSWMLDLGAQQRYIAGVRAGRIQPRPYHEVPELWKPETLPEKKGFDVAKEALDSDVQSAVRDFHEGDLTDLEAFDVVLYLGVLYRLEDPLRGLRRVAQVTAETAIIESEAVFLRDREDHAFCQFYRGAELNDDPTNWWVPNLRAFQDRCLAAGFDRAEPVTGPPPVVIDSSAPMPHYRAVVHAHK